MDDTQWHLDKRVPVTLLVLLVSQIVGFGYLFGQLKQMVESNTDAITRITNELAIRRPVIDDNRIAIAAIRQALEDIRASQLRIETKLDAP